MAVMNLIIQINNNNNTDCSTLRTATIMSNRMQPIVDRKAQSQRKIDATFVTWPVLIYRMFIRRSKLMATANQLPRKVSLDCTCIFIIPNLVEFKHDYDYYTVAKQ